MIGMNHEFDHNTTNDNLAKLKESDGIDLQLPYDGYSLHIKLPANNETTAQASSIANPVS